MLRVAAAFEVKVAFSEGDIKEVGELRVENVGMTTVGVREMVLLANDDRLFREE